MFQDNLRAAAAIGVASVAIAALTGALPSDPAVASGTKVPAPGTAKRSAPSNPGPNYFGTINLRTGKVTPVRTRSTTFQPKGLIYLP